MSDKLKLFSLTPQKVELDNGQCVHLRRLTALERVEWFDYLQERTKDSEDAGVSLAFALDDSAKLLVMSLCDSEGKRIFEDTELDTVKQIDAKTLDRLAHDTLALNGMTQESRDDVKKK